MKGIYDIVDGPARQEPTSLRLKFKSSRISLDTIVDLFHSRVRSVVYSNVYDWGCSVVALGDRKAEISTKGQRVSLTLGLSKDKQATEEERVFIDIEVHGTDGNSQYANERMYS
ncbi:MAG: hypothetical protein EOP07_24990 [Proteobacteria bacterium]|nr:MAG: hypothetical protein EOP07_24990 [Pseudomonadota bacterium]